MRGRERLKAPLFAQNYFLCFMLLHKLEINHYTVQWLRKASWEELTNMICHILANEVAVYFYNNYIYNPKNLEQSKSLPAKMGEHPPERNIGNSHCLSQGWVGGKLRTAWRARDLEKRTVT